MVTQLTSITQNAGAAVGVSVVVGILVALWSASSGMAHMVQAVSIAYDEEETLTFVKLRTLAPVLTLGAIVFMLTAVAVIAVQPALIAHTGLGLVGRVLVGVARWVLLLIGMMLALSVLYATPPTATTRAVVDVTGGDRRHDAAVRRSSMHPAWMNGQRCGSVSSSTAGPTGVFGSRLATTA